jgi:hypothetical protein
MDASTNGQNCKGKKVKRATNCKGDQITLMKMKLLMQWDIRSGRDSQYLEFIVREFVPSVARMGLQIVDAWYTLYGDAPQILVAGVAPDEQALRNILISQEWEKLLESLSKHVSNFEKKIIPDRGRFQI